MHRSRIQQDRCSQAAITGTVYGSNFDEKPDNCHAIVKKVKLRFDPSRDSHISAIQLVYQLSNGQEYVGTRYGGSGDREFTTTINVGRGERIIGVVRISDALIQRLGFYTNEGSFRGLYGGCTCIGESFNTYGCQLRGITGTYLSHTLTSIGFYCSDI